MRSLVAAISVGSLSAGDLALQDVDELAVLPARGVDALQVLERRQEVRVDLERALEVADRLIGLAHLRVEQLAELVQDLLAIEVGDGDVERARQRRAHAAASSPLFLIELAICRSAPTLFGSSWTICA